MTNFEKELAELINKYGRENESDTPDFILADYLRQCLTTFTAITRRRDKWYNNDPVSMRNQVGYPAEKEVEALVHIGNPVAHVVGEVIVGTSPSGSEHHCHGKCEYSPGLIKLDEIKIHSDDGVLLGVSDVDGNITDATEDQSGVSGRIDTYGSYIINLTNYKGLAPLITYDYEYDLPLEKVKRNKG